VSAEQFQPVCQGAAAIAFVEHGARLCFGTTT
jgi:hypothetical protein